jgi:3-phenylpropionate/cinnamic acid dioxygenase small subunit
MPKGDIYSAEQVRMMSQDMGLNDRQIAEKLKCERATITKLRKRHKIPTCIISNRRDKTYVCVGCNTTVYIKRKERRRAFCLDCQNK